MSEQEPPPLAVLLATLNVPSRSVSSVKPLLAAEIVGSTETANADLDVRDPALPAVTAATASRSASATAKRLIFLLSCQKKGAYPLATIATSCPRPPCRVAVAGRTS